MADIQAYSHSVTEYMLESNVSAEQACIIELLSFIYSYLKSFKQTF